MVMSWFHDIVLVVFVKRTMVEIQCVLLSRLTDASAVGSLRHAADDEALICTHFDKVEAVDEVLQIPQGT